MTGRERPRRRPRLTLLTLAGLAAFAHAAGAYYRGTDQATVYAILGAAIIGIDARFDALEGRR